MDYRQESFSKDGCAHDFKKYMCEMLGTMILVFIGCGVASTVGFLTASSALITALAFGLTFAAMYFVMGKISGCHLNPAVSLGMCIAKKISVKDFIFYTILQVVGAFVGILLLWLVLGSRLTLGANMVQPTIARNTMAGTYIIGLIAEIILTFVFVLSFLSASKREVHNSTGLMIGLFLTATYLLGVLFTGGALNPARSLASASVQTGTALRQVWIFIVGPFIGAILAGFEYIMLRKKKECACNAEIEETHE